MRAPALLEARLLTGAALGDEELSREALGLCRLVLSSQRPDGNFGCEGESFAARGRMLRALDAAYSLTGDKEILLFFLLTSFRINGKPGKRTESILFSFFNFFADIFHDMAS